MSTTSFSFLRLVILIFIFISINPLFAQPPQRMSYQAVVRSTDNQLVLNRSVRMRISLLADSMNASASYVETHQVTTNALGVVHLEIGGGTVLSGSFTAIPWSRGKVFIKTETDPSGGSTYTLVSTTQLMSVPYALYSGDVPVSKNGDTVTIGKSRLIIPGAKLLSGMPSTLSTGLMAYYPFNGNANDESGNGFNGTVNGATLTTDRFGNGNSAFGFDALKSNFIATTRSLSEAKDGSISAWIYFTGEINGGNPGTYNDWYSIVDKFLVNGNKNDARHLKLVFSASDANQIFSDNVVSTNAWRHVVITSSSNIAKIYIDGIQSGIKALAPGYNFFEKIPFIIGKSVNNRWHFNGRIDDIRLYNRALTQEEITYLTNY